VSFNVPPDRVRTDLEITRNTRNAEAVQERFLDRLAFGSSTAAQNARPA
jgi:hypothetical protein